MLLRDNVYDSLRAAILACELPPGQDLREQDLAARLGCSRSPIRDALLRLENEHLVTVLPRQGYRVNAISLQDARDLFGLRLVIEPACAAAAAQAPDTSVLDAYRERGDADFVTYNRNFHAAIAALSGNARMAAVARDLAEQSDRLVRVSLSRFAEDRLVVEHVGIIEAIQAGDAQAAADKIRSHIADATARVLGALQSTKETAP